MYFPLIPFSAGNSEKKKKTISFTQPLKREHSLDSFFKVDRLIFLELLLGFHLQDGIYYNKQNKRTAHITASFFRCQELFAISKAFVSKFSFYVTVFNGYL